MRSRHSAGTDQRAHRYRRSTNWRTVNSLARLNMFHSDLACVLGWMAGFSRDPLQTIAADSRSRRTLITKSISHGRSKFEVHADGETQLCGAFLPSDDPNPSAAHNRCLTSVNEPLSALVTTWRIVIASVT